MIKVGIIGCGKIAQVRHIPEYQNNPYAEVAALYDVNSDRARELAEKCGAKAYDTVEALLADQEIEAVSICAANYAHAELAIKALRAGKHVLCEKPMAMNLPDCEEMVAVAKETGRFLMIGHNQRLAAAHAKARKLVEEGVIGEILNFRTTFGHGGPEFWAIGSGKNVWFFDKKLTVMGVMADLGVHKTDLIQFLTGHKVVKATAKLATLDKKYEDGRLIDVDDNAVCIYELDNGAIGTMTASWTYYGQEDNGTVLYGTKGIMRIYDVPDMPLVVRTRDGQKFSYELDAIQDNLHQGNSGVIDLWVDCLRTNTPPEISGESALYSMRAVFAAVESSETGRTVEIEANRV